MSDDSDPPISDDHGSDSPFNRGPSKSASEDFARLIKRAIKKIKRDTGHDASLRSLAELLKTPVLELRQSIEKCNRTTKDNALRAALVQILAGNDKQGLPAITSQYQSRRSGHFRAGESLACKILAAEPGGYAVIIPEYNLRGFLPTESKLRIGEEIIAQYVCVHNNRILLSARMSAESRRPSPTHDHWEEGEKLMGTSDSIFQRQIQNRRASDLFLTPIDKNQQPNRMRIGQPDDLLWLITDLEGAFRTGCLKANCQPRHSRSAVLLYKGRAVGSVYNSSQLRESPATQSSLQMMLSDCTIADTQLVMYALPEEVVLAMSSLFLGHPVERSDDLDALSYTDYLMSWLLKREQTACIAYALGDADSVLSFVHKGIFVGSFDVENQEFSHHIELVHKRIREQPKAKAKAWIFPNELLLKGARLGFSLSLNLPKTDL